jgi:hypothetical protein
MLVFVQYPLTYFYFCISEIFPIFNPNSVLEHAESINDSYIGKTFIISTIRYKKTFIAEFGVIAKFQLFVFD